jgi:sterol desaturase/sphingolipid hydroxylase (fatty acid hydroxylase superfamily)
MSDRSLLRFAVGFFVLALVFGLLERLARPAVPRRRSRRELVTDLAYWIVTPWLTKTLTRVALGSVLVAVAVALGVRADLDAVRAALPSTPISRLSFGLQLALGLALSDFVGYWAHRLFHGRALWRFHAVHHSSRTLDWLAATRLHPFNDVLVRVLQAVPLLLLGFDTRVFAAVAPILSVYAVLLHADVPWTFGPLRWVLASPHFHRWHHAADAEGRDKNFAGLLPLWDLVFGTFYMPAHRPAATGVDDPVPAGLGGQLAWPFRRSS